MDTNFIAILLSGKNPVTAALVPSSVFVVILMVIFAPFADIPTGINDLIEQGIFILISSAIIGVFLQFLNTTAFKFLEGYGILSKIPFLGKLQVKQAEKLLEEREILANKIEKLKKKYKNLDKEEREKLARLFDKYYSVAVKYDQTFPPNLDTIMPTRFGNILRASEAYPLTRYGIDSVPFWRLLIGVMPESYKENIAQSRNELSFFVNCIVLSLLSALIFFALVVSQLASGSVNFINLVVFFLSIAFTSLFYQSSLSHALNFGEMVRGAYDLYRLDILGQLKLKTPRNSHNEFFLWKNLGEFVNLGAASFDFDLLEYDRVKGKEKM